MTLDLRTAGAAELETVESLLERHGLPTADVRDGTATFYLAETDGALVGVGGLEIVGTAALLRSVAVQARGRGHGRAICDRLEARAEAAGVEALYLLTETATGFFERLGYEHIDRRDAPEAIQETPEYRELCADTAACMRKRL